MDRCEAMDSWALGELSDIEKQDLLREFINDFVKEFGYDAPNVDFAPLEGKWAIYDPHTGTVTIDTWGLNNVGAAWMLRKAAHEAYHAIQDQMLDLENLPTEVLQEMRAGLEGGAMGAEDAAMDILNSECKAGISDSAAANDLPTEGDAAQWDLA